MRMDERLAKAIGEFSSLLKEDSRVCHLDGLEKALYEDKEVIFAAHRKEAALSAYNDALKVKGEDDPATLLLQRNLLEAKEALDAIPLVAAYNAAYTEVAALYRQVDDILFYPYCGLRIFKRHC